jgi:hypothetical protein
MRLRWLGKQDSFWAWDMCRHGDQRRTDRRGPHRASHGQGLRDHRQRRAHQRGGHRWPHFPALVVSSCDAEAHIKRACTLDMPVRQASLLFCVFQSHLWKTSVYVAGILVHSRMTGMLA